MPRTRRITAWVLVVLASLLIPISVISVWAIRTVTNTDQYVATLAPLARNQIIVDHLAQKATDALFSTHIVQDKVSAALPAKAKPVITPIVAEVHNYVYGLALKVFESPKFGQLWDTLNRHTHDAVIDVLTGQQSPLVQRLEKGGGIAVNVTPALNNVIDQANANGVTLFNPLKPILTKGDKLGVTMVSKAQVSKFTGFFNAIVTLKWVVPIVALVLGILGIMIAVEHRKTLLRMAIGVALFTLVLLAGLSLGRITFVNQAGHTFNRQVAETVWDTMLRFLVGDLRWMLLVAFLFALGAWLAGPARYAVCCRSTVARGARWVAAEAQRAEGGCRRQRHRLGRRAPHRWVDSRAPQRPAHRRGGRGGALPRVQWEPERLEPPDHRDRAGRVSRAATARGHLGQKGVGPPAELRHGIDPQESLASVNLHKAPWVEGRGRVSQGSRWSRLHETRGPSSFETKMVSRARER